MNVGRGYVIQDSKFVSIVTKVGNGIELLGQLKTHQKGLRRKPDMARRIIDLRKAQSSYINYITVQYGPLYKETGIHQQNSIEYKIQNLIACNVKSNDFLQTYILFANGYIFVVSHFCLVTD